MTRDTIAGFLLGIGTGVAVGYYLNPINEERMPLGIGARDSGGQVPRTANGVRADKNRLAAGRREPHAAASSGNSGKL
jgi:hypothetical protein